VELERIINDQKTPVIRKKFNELYEREIDNRTNDQDSFEIGSSLQEFEEEKAENVPSRISTKTENKSQ
jgi:hypothetical protein